jgi:dihydrofolate synthase / folylpolyglutamate synthase
MTYPDVLHYMYDQLPMFHRVGKTAYKADLDTAIYLDEYFHYPHRKYATVHVAGTNGKGSVSHTLAAILQTAGYKTGLFTSPHLVDFRERIRVNGEMISETAVVEFIEKHHPVFDEVKPSFFEMTSALALYYFAKEKVDIAIVEVGMGGRLDSTNVIKPLVSIITNIGLDHTEYLGDTLDKIAAEKAGIIKEGVPAIVGEYNPQTWPVFEQFARKLNAPISRADYSYNTSSVKVSTDRKIFFDIYRQNRLFYKNLKYDLAGFYQQKNVCTVLAAVEELRKAGYTITDDQVYMAFAHVTSLTGLQGRWQTIGRNPTILCDTAHNVDGIAWVVEQIKSLTYDKLHIVFGVVKDKDVTAILKLLPTNAQYYFCNADIPRALNAYELQEKAKKFKLHGEAYTSVALALAAAKEKATREDVIFIGGSTFVVGEVFQSLQQV